MFLLSHDLSQVHRKGDIGDEDDGKKGDTIMLLNGDGGRPKRGALCGFHKTIVPNCVNVCFIACLLAVLFGGSAVGVKTGALVVSLVPWSVCVVGFSVVIRQFDDVACNGFRGPEEQGRGIQEQVVAEKVISASDSTDGCAQRRGCAWLAKAQATARVDVSTAPRQCCGFCFG